MVVDEELLIILDEIGNVAGMKLLHVGFVDDDGDHSEVIDCTTNTHLFEEDEPSINK